MFTWINHNSLYILIFIFPFVISTFTYFYISKNRLFILLIFISLTAFFILVRLIFAPQEPSQQEKIELSSIEQNGKIVVQFFSPNCLGCVLSEIAINNLRKHIQKNLR